MNGFTEQAYKVFELFDKQWALVTAGTPEQFNSCTVAWGSLGKRKETEPLPPDSAPFRCFLPFSP